MFDKYCFSLPIFHKILHYLFAWIFYHFTCLDILEGYILFIPSYELLTLNKRQIYHMEEIILFTFNLIITAFNFSFRNKFIVMQFLPWKYSLHYFIMCNITNINKNLHNCITPQLIWCSIRKINIIYLFYLYFGSNNIIQIDPPPPSPPPIRTIPLLEISKWIQI